MPPSHPREILIEYTQIGNTMRVTAVDVITGTEVTFQAPASASRSETQRIAADKLRYVINKRKT